MWLRGTSFFSVLLLVKSECFNGRSNGDSAKAKLSAGALKAGTEKNGPLTAGSESLAGERT